MDYGELPAKEQQERLKELAIAFLKLGTIAFGGPAAHIAMMQTEFVERRQWLNQTQLMDMIGFANLIPGPNSTEIAIHIGLERGGWRGLVVAGSCFIFPALVIVWMLAIIYKQYQTLPQLNSILYGIKPVIIGILIQALWKLRTAGIKNIFTGMALTLAIALFYLGVNEVLLLFGSGLFVMTAKKMRSPSELMSLVVLPSQTVTPILKTEPATVMGIFLTFLKIGAVLYGGGYVLFAFLQKELVERSHWLTSQQLLDAISVGQFTPGPLFTTATFVGYLIGGDEGAIAATMGIFLPSFIFVAVFSRFLEKLRRSNLMAGFLDGVNAAALGLMVVVTLQLGQTSVVNVLTILILLVNTILLFTTKINSTWLLLAGAAIGLISDLVVIG